MIDNETLELLVSHGADAGDMAMIDAAMDGRYTPAQIFRRGLRESLTQLERNGLIKVVPRDEWPAYVVIESPSPNPL